MHVAVEILHSERPCASLYERWIGLVSALEAWQPIGASFERRHSLRQICDSTGCPSVDLQGSVDVTAFTWTRLGASHSLRRECHCVPKRFGALAFLAKYTALSTKCIDSQQIEAREGGSRVVGGKSHRPLVLAE